MKQFMISLIFFAGLAPGWLCAQAAPPAPANIQTNAQPDPAAETLLLSNWTEALNFGISTQRLAVVKQIRSLKATNMIPPLQEHFFKENNIAVKEEIVYTFIEATNNSAPFWQKVFAEESNIVALQRAAYAVEQMKGPDVGAQIYQRLTNDLTNEKSMRFNANAVRALGELKYQAATPSMLEVATNRALHQDYRGSAVLALGIMQDGAQLQLLNEILTNTAEPRSLRRYAALGIGRLESPEAFDILAPIATNEIEDQSVRSGAIAGLAFVKNSNQLAVMEALSKSDSTTLRVEAVRALGKSEGEASQTILKYKAFKDPEAVVRREARTALQALGVDVDLLEKEMRSPPATNTNMGATNTPPANTPAPAAQPPAAAPPVGNAVPAPPAR